MSFNVHLNVFNLNVSSSMYCRVLNEILEEKYDESDVRAILRAYAKNPAAALAARRFIHENWPTMVDRLMLYYDVWEYEDFLNRCIFFFFRFKDSYWTLRAFVGASSRLLFTAHDMEEVCLIIIL